MSANSCCTFSGVAKHCPTETWNTYTAWGFGSSSPNQPDTTPHPASVNRAIATAENDPPVLIATPKDRPVVTVRVVPTGVDKG
jgi:hypothetical protein